MHYIDSSTTTGTNSLGSMPTPTAASSTPGWFAHGNSSLGTPYTVVTSDFLNSIQAEILNVLGRAGIVPSKTNQAQLLQAIQAIGRIKSLTPVVLYVSPTGNDSNDGTSGSPYATVQKAVNTILYNYDLGGSMATINLAAGTYSVGSVGGAAVNAVTVANATCNGAIHIVGNTTTPTSCKIKVLGPGTCISAGGNAPPVYVSGLAFEGGGTVAGQSSALAAFNGGQIYFDNVAFGPVMGSHIAAGSGGAVGINPNAYSGKPYGYAIYGGAQCHFDVGSSSAIIEASSASATISGGALTFAGGANGGAFVWADAAGLIDIPGWTYVLAGGTTVTGKRYNIANGAYVQTNGQYASMFPGSTAGTNTSGYLA